MTFLYEAFKNFLDSETEDEIENHKTDANNNHGEKPKDCVSPCPSKKNVSQRKKSKTRSRSRSKHAFNFTCFPRYKEIEKWLKKIAKTYPNRVKLETIGESIQKRPIYMIILKGCINLPKISIMLEAGIHAREWLAPTTAIYFVNYLITNPEELKFADIYVIPCLNPDGYEYTHTTERLWRKNLNKNGSQDPDNWGVDLNRNFPFAYGLPGSSNCPASLTYHGKHSLSEPETQSLANALNKYGKYIQFYLAIHSYGNLIMYPWGYTLEPIPDEPDLKKCAQCGALAMKKAFSSSSFSVGSIARKMYLSSGGSSDYARGCHNIKFSYTIELHPGGKSGFEAKTSQIIKVGKEVRVGIKAMIEYVYHFYTVRNLKRKSSESELYCTKCKRFKSS